MFFYKITVRSKRGKDARTSRNTYHELTKTSYVGEIVTGYLERRDVTSVSVTRITQAAYQRATA